MKNILITGASDGLGKAIAIKFATEIKKDCRILLHCNSNETKCNLLAEKLQKEFGCFTYVIKADFSIEKEVENMCDKIIKEFGNIDILINNAAFVFDGELEERTWEIFDKTMKVNLITPFYLSKIFGLQMKNKGFGKIINISSTNGIDYNSPYSLDYDASKAGIISLTKNMAQILAPNVNVNCIAPHWMNTDMNKELDKEFLQEECQKILKGRFAEPSEVAELAYFLTKDETQYLTGQVYSFGSYKY